VRLATKIVPGVSVNTILCLVFGLRKGTPNRLKVEEVEIDVYFEFINEIDGQLSLSVREGAVVSVFTFSFEAGGAELGPVFIRMVKLFDSRVAVNARISLWALFFLGDVTAKLRFVRAWRSSSIFGFFVIC